MQIIDRYIASAFLKNLLLALVSLTALFLFQALMGQLLDHEFPVNQIVYYHLMMIPEVLVQMAPPAVLLSTVLTLSGLNRTNELTACFSIGIGLSRVMVVIWSIVFALSCGLLILQDQILPPVFKQRDIYYMREMKKRTDFFVDIKQNKVWYRSKNVIYNLKTFDLVTKKISGMSVYTFDEEFRLRQVIEAARAEFLPSGWRLFDGKVTVIEKEQPFPLTQKFAIKDLAITERPKDFEEIEKQVDSLRLKELKAYIDRARETGTDTRNFEVKYWSRWSMSFVPIIMCFLGVPFSTRSRREGGVAKDLLTCLVITFFYWLFYSVGLSLGKNGTVIPWIAAWLPSVCFGILAIFLLIRKQAKT
jgi:lipopolysaccharide export system permease protein